MKELDKGDYDAIKWIQENLSGTPIILEASSDDSSYSYISRVSANTGLPTVIGWARHEYICQISALSHHQQFQHTLYRFSILCIVSAYSVSFQHFLCRVRIFCICFSVLCVISAFSMPCPLLVLLSPVHKPFRPAFYPVQFEPHRACEIEY